MQNPAATVAMTVSMVQCGSKNCIFPQSEMPDRSLFEDTNLFHYMAHYHGKCKPFFYISKESRESTVVVGGIHKPLKDKKRTGRVKIRSNYDQTRSQKR